MHTSSYTASNKNKIKVANPSSGIKRDTIYANPDAGGTPLAEADTNVATKADMMFGYVAAPNDKVETNIGVIQFIYFPKVVVQINLNSLTISSNASMELNSITPSSN